MQLLNSIRSVCLIIMVLVLISGCDGNRPFENYSQYDLSKEYGECQSKNLSPGGAQRCRNIEKECEIRRKERGIRC